MNNNWKFFNLVIFKIEYLNNWYFFIRLNGACGYKANANMVRKAVQTAAGRLPAADSEIVCEAISYSERIA